MSRAQLSFRVVLAVRQDGAVWAQNMCAAMKVPGLERWGVGAADARPDSTLVVKSMGASSMKGNPIKLTAEECGAPARRAAAALSLPPVALGSRLSATARGAGDMVTQSLLTALPASKL